jgi:hypothetical protein
MHRMWVSTELGELIHNVWRAEAGRKPKWRSSDIRWVEIKVNGIAANRSCPVNRQVGVSAVRK